MLAEGRRREIARFKIPTILGADQRGMGQEVGLHASLIDSLGEDIANIRSSTSATGVQLRGG